MDNSINLYEIVNNREYNYSEIYSHPKVIKSLNDNDRVINFIVGVKGMTEIFRATLENILEVKNLSINNKDINIVVVEQDDEPLNFEFCSNLSVDYIFIPQEISKSDNLHSTSLMYNIGFLYPKKSDWYIFHCADLLIPKDYFNILFQSYIPLNPKWLQCFTNKRVKLLTPEATNIFLNKIFLTSTEEFKLNHFLPDPSIGAPGGSIMVPYKTFISVGGYDPELFFGYTFEDAFFWYKLEATLSDKCCDKQHSGLAMYADNPPIELYHLQEYIKPPNDLSRNKYFLIHNNIINTFLKDFNYVRKLHYINFKRKLLEKHLNLYERFIKNN